MDCARPGRIPFFPRKEKCWEHCVFTLVKNELSVRMISDSLRWLHTSPAWPLNATAPKKRCGEAKVFLLMDRESATPEAGAGIFPLEKSFGRTSNLSCSVSSHKLRL